MRSFAGAPSISYTPTVFPVLQGPATDTFAGVAADFAGTIPVNSATRTLPQQLLLFAWYTNSPRLCNANLAARPGNSNHNGGLAVDIGSSGTWATRMRGRQFIDNVSSEPWHFFYSGAGTMDIRSLSVLAFQKLYNRNFPENPIDEDGVYGPQTEAALRESPADGFSRAPSCPAVNAFVAHPYTAPVRVDWRYVAEDTIRIRANGSGGMETVRYTVVETGEVVSVEREEPFFNTLLNVPTDQYDQVSILIEGFDIDGDLRGRSLAVLTADPNVFARPLGDGVYEIASPQLDDRLDIVVNGRSVDDVVRTNRGWAISTDVTDAIVVAQTESAQVVFDIAF